MVISGVPEDGNLHSRYGQPHSGPERSTHWSITEARDMRLTVQHQNEHRTEKHYKRRGLFTVFGVFRKPDTAINLGVETGWILSARALFFLICFSVVTPLLQR